MNTAEREITARVEALVATCADVELNTGRAPGATPVDEHALVLARRIRDQLVVARTSPIPEMVRALVHAERQAQLMFELQGTAFARTSAVEVLARAAIRDGYRAIMRQVRALGVARSDGHAALAPALVIEPMATPVTFLQGDARMVARHRPGEATALPFPVVFAPPYPEVALGALSVLQHEVGHSLDRALQLTEELRPLVAARTAAAGQNTWPAWTREVVADALGTLLASVGLGGELLGWRAVYPGPDGGRSNAHPPLAARGALCWYWLIELGVPAECATMATLAGARDEYAVRDAAEAERLHDLAALVMTQPLRALNGGALRDLAPDLARDHAVAIEAGRRPDASLGCVPDRLVPLVAALRIDAGGAPDQVTKRILLHATERPTSAASARDVLFWTEQIGAARPPILDDQAGWRKVPPVALIAKARAAVFVGAINDRLRQTLDDARLRTRVGALESLEVYFLRTDAVRAMAPDPKAAAEHVAKGLTARGVLGPPHLALDDEFLDSIAQTWTIYEFDHPYFFASYLDVDLPGGRIHVSSHGWGRDIKSAPAIDYVWPPGQARPIRAYEWYRDALTGLRQKARVLRQRTTATTPAR